MNAGNRSRFSTGWARDGGPILGQQPAIEGNFQEII
jgi:hypothetical protein